MGFASLFFKDEESTKTVEVSQQQPKAPVFANISEGSVPTISSGVPDEKFVTMLENVIVENNINGLDYFEFKQAIEKMKTLPIDEATKFMTVYSTFELQGCTKEVLIAAIDKYIALIQKEQENFNTEMNISFKESVEDKKLEVEKAQQQIAELNNQIVELNNFIMTTTQTSQQEEMKLRMADANFKQSVQKVISAMTTDKDKITNYIK